MGYYKDFLYSNAITWTTDGANAGTVKFRKGPFYCTNVCGVLISECGYANKMMAEALNRIAYKYVSHVGNPKLMNNTMSEIVFSYPQNIEEQQTISFILEELDNLITLHQRKYEKLTSIKKALLEKMFPANGEKQPKIRFKGFIEDWEQRKLNDVVDIYDGVHQTPDYKDSGIMFLSVENIDTLSSEKYISEEAFNRDYKIYPENGDILMTRIGDVGTPNVVETTKKIAYYVSLALLKLKNVDSYFACNSILSPRFKNGLRERTLTTAIPQKINKDEIGKVDFIYPISLKEQIEIGKFFKNLNSLITLHQRKYKKLKNIKNALLERMFC